MNANSIRTKRLAATLLAAFLALPLLAAAPVARAQAGDAKSILKRMSDYVSSQQTIELAFDSGIEVVTPQQEKIQFTNSGDVLVQRPDKLRARRTGGYADVALYFDGKTVSVLGKNLNRYTRFELPGNLDQLIEGLRAGYAVALPGADLLLSNPYNALIAGVVEAKHIGRGVVGGVECEHLAFRNADTDWQLWVEVGKRPIPRKLVISSKDVQFAPQYTLQITRWKSGFKPAPDAFVFTPPHGAQALARDDLIMLDELPPGLPTEGKK